MNNKVLNIETFAKGIELINTILAKNAKITNNETLDTYYILLQDINNELYMKGIISLLKSWENPHFIPSPAQIIEEVNKVLLCGLDKEDFILLAKAYKLTGKKYKNNEINRVLEIIDIDKMIDIKEVKYLK